MFLSDWPISQSTPMTAAMPNTHLPRSAARGRLLIRFPLARLRLWLGGSCELGFPALGAAAAGSILGAGVVAASCPHRTRAMKGLRNLCLLPSSVLLLRPSLPPPLKQIRCAVWFPPSRSRAGDARRADNRALSDPALPCQPDRAANARLRAPQRRRRGQGPASQLLR